MAKTYDFRFILRKAIFSETDGVGFVTIPYGSSSVVNDDGEYVASFERETQPRRWLEFMRGDRYSK